MNFNPRTNYDAYAMAVIGASANLFGILPRDILMVGRHRKRSWPRMAAAWALREADPGKGLKGAVGPDRKVFTLPRLCQIFPWNDHTSALHALRRVEEIRATDMLFRARTDALRRFAIRHRPQGHE